MLFSVDAGSVSDHVGRSSAHLTDPMSRRANSLGRAQRAEQLLHSSLFDYIDSKHSHGPLFYNFLYIQHTAPNRVLRPQFCLAALDLWNYYVEDPLALGSSYDLGNDSKSSFSATSILTFEFQRELKQNSLNDKRMKLICWTGQAICNQVVANRLMSAMTQSILYYQTLSKLFSK